MSERDVESDACPEVVNATAEVDAQMREYAARRRRRRANLQQLLDEADRIEAELARPLTFLERIFGRKIG